MGVVVVGKPDVVGSDVPVFELVRTELSWAAARLLFQVEGADAFVPVTVHAGLAGRTVRVPAPDDLHCVVTQNHVVLWLERKL